MVHKELQQAWWFDSHNLARTSPWLGSTLSGSPLAPYPALPSGQWMLLLPCGYSMDGLNLDLV
uniref:Uncharacterized protein n=1 Tax=Aegilops tauschii subsp. strangulata TaxID=200361 RepID=A0A453AS04_AEGTS